MLDLIRGFVKDEDGMQTIEMVIILVVLVGIAFSFRKTMLNWYNELIAEAQRPPGIGAPVDGGTLAGTK